MPISVNNLGSMQYHTFRSHRCKIIRQDMSIILTKKKSLFGYLSKNIFLWKIKNQKTMSFAGHVFDMIRRDQAQREIRNERRTRRSRLREKIYEKKGEWPQNPNLTPEKLEYIRQQITAHKRKEQRYIQRTTLLISALCIIVASLILLFLK